MWAIIPVKNLEKAKTRLADTLSPEERKAFCLAVLRDQIAALKTIKQIGPITLLSRDENCISLAQELGIEHLVLEEDTGLNEGLTAAMKVVRSRGAKQVMILHSDIPLLTGAAVENVINKHQGSGGITLVPSNKKDGTNIMLVDLPLEIALHYGKDSLEKHITAAKRNKLKLQIVEDHRLGLDIDTSAELSILTNCKYIPEHCSAFLSKHCQKPHREQITRNLPDANLSCIASL